MKTFIFVLLVALVFAGSWDLPDSLPSSYTGLPFSFQLGSGYGYVANGLPAWAVIDSSKGIITGKSEKAGAWPFTLDVSRKSDKIKKQYILNVIDQGQAEKNIWAGKADNYYSRQVVNPFRIVASTSDKTFVKAG